MSGKMSGTGPRGTAAVVTGGASGLGFAVAARLLAGGARVEIWDRSEELLKDALDRLLPRGNVTIAVVDVTDWAAVRDAADRAGEIDVLVNSAGITCPPMAIADYDLRVWHDVVQVDLCGTFHCCRAVLPGMISRGRGRVVNIASMAGKEGNPGETAYSAAKAGVIGLTKALGKEAAASGVLVNAVAPGIMATPMRTSAADPALVEALLARTPAGRPGELAELAELVAFVASDACSYTAGFVFDFSGGRATY
ncbi:SDR family oxidoreductase [Amycolatopsis rubida]|uniref:3-oxoacyl-[acyl-carrier protein] reductase n=1 Tax=Amycolatopsis rubida TaxID=112413 RepID=A0A1I5V4N9_9PSEU|nr:MULTISPECIES: SDR family NAD(P)-dependent oxidoreductase [Amycolatopsis]MYW94347.1 SDR family NAD(P)-dependent oxidoreductase [Amycolatopsis rubida]NEC59336.1 SDR family oxidoreductase [Amycolatopsis rubida]OAP26832.1 3-oxoacyl-[acyl-carrier-protein] reductase FabG [Amycolatopsis sp. M39]SFQ02342.1 3-oxoacyl-[acyl-carrier protein] reductase [Amycolatopsis rubida]